MTILHPGASGFDWGRLPLHADAIAGEGWGPPDDADAFVLGSPTDGREPRYPGARPPGSFVVHGDCVHHVRPGAEASGWEMTRDDGTAVDLDAWLRAAGQAPMLGRRLSLGYGSNLNPTQIAGFAAGTAVVVLRALTVGLGSVYCTSRRSVDGQFPAGLAGAAADRVEVHGLVLIDPAVRPRLDAKEGQGRTYNRMAVSGRAAPIAAVLEDGTMVAEPLPVYLQGSRALAHHAGRHVLLAEVEQRAFASAAPHAETADHGLLAARLNELPGLAAAPLPVFAYGTLRPGQSRWPAIADRIASHEPATVHGQRFDTGFGYPGLVLGGPADRSVDGRLLHPTAAAYRDLLGRLDAIEGHPFLFARHLIRIEDGRLAWTYLWNGDVPCASMP